jgi:hypothetical protein
MSRSDITTCEFVLEAEYSAREARKKAADDWSSPLALAYYQVSLELRRIVSRHVAKEECAACRGDETRRQATECIAHLGSSVIHSLVGDGLGNGVTQ